MNAINGFSGKFRFLSNFFPSPITVCDREWPSVEHAYQAMKTDDQEWWETIRTAKTPARAKHLGQKVPKRENWERIKLRVMLLLLRKKFELPGLKDCLVATHPFHLEETNHWGDVFWGVCDGVGENHLGRLLMQVRDEIISKESKTETGS